MKNITQKEFEEVVQAIMDKKITRKQAAKDLETDLRTLNHRITELSETNPALFEEYIAVFPYQPKEIKVDIDNLAILVIKNGLVRTSEATGISVRSISRKVKTLENTNPELYELYRHRNDRRSNIEELKFQKDLEEMSGSSLVIRSELQEKEEEIRKILTEFEKLVESGLSKAEAARRLGYDGYPTIWKKYQDMKRIVSEKEIKTAQDNDNQASKEQEVSKAKSFRDNVKASTMASIQIDGAEGRREKNKDKETEGKQGEGR